MYPLAFITYRNSESFYSILQNKEEELFPLLYLQDTAALPDGGVELIRAQVNSQRFYVVLRVLDV